MLKRGEASFAGASIGVLAELDYFAWASFSPIGRRNTNVRVTVADAKTGVVRSMASKTLKLPIELMLSEQTNPHKSFMDGKNNGRTQANCSNSVVTLSGLERYCSLLV